MANSVTQGSQAARQTWIKEINEALESLENDCLNDSLPEALDKIVEVAGKGSQARDTRHHNPHDNWHDVAEAARRTRSALDAYRAEQLPPNKPDEGKKPWGGASEAETNFKREVEHFRHAVEAVINSRE